MTFFDKFFNKRNVTVGNLNKVKKYDKLVTHVFLLLDETGSMEYVKHKTLSALNDYVENLSGSVCFYLCKFNAEKTTFLYDGVELDEVIKFRDRDYTPNHGTNLYDSIVIAINKLEPQVGMMDKVVFTIITDGEENSSKYYNLKDVKEAISEHETWQFVFLGANIDSEKVAKKMDISLDCVSNFSTDNINTVLKSEANRAMGYMSGTKANMGYTSEEKKGYL